MKVYWTTSINYEAKEKMVEFCEENGLVYEWQKSPKKHYVILDMLERDISHLINDFVGEEVKVTRRDNKVRAKQQLRNAVHSAVWSGYRDLPTNVEEAFAEKVAEIEAVHHVKLERMEVLSILSDEIYNYESLLMKWNEDAKLRYLIDEITSKIMMIEWEQDKQKELESYKIAKEAIAIWNPEGRKNVNNSTSPQEVKKMLEILYEKETGIIHEFDPNGLSRALYDVGIKSYWYPKHSVICVKQSSVNSLRAMTI